MTAGRVPAAVLALAGLLTFGLAVIAVHPNATVGQALAPWTDGPEYLDAAVHLRERGRYRIHVGGEEHPPRYPFGYSVLIAGALLAGTEPVVAPHRVNQIAGLALLALVALPLWRRRRFLEAGLAVLLLATLPAFLILGRSPLSDLSSSVVVLAGVLALFGYARGGRSRQGMLGAALLGIAVCFRTSNLLLLCFVPAAVAARHGARRRALGELARLGLCAAAGLLPVIGHNQATFGDPATSGYDYWIPGGPGGLLGYQNLVASLPYLWREVTQREVLFTTANLYGGGSYVGPGFVLLALLAPLGIRRDRRFWCFAAAGALSAAGFALFSRYQDARLFFPLLVLAIPLAASGLGGLWRPPEGRRRYALAVPASLLCLAAVLALPGRGAFSGLPVLLFPPTRAAPAPAFATLTGLAALADAGPRLVLTDMPPPLVHALLGGDRLVAPLLDEHLFRWNPASYVFDGADRRRLLAAALEQGRSVWAATADPAIGLAAACPPPAGYLWQVLRPGVARLELAGAGPPEPAPR